MLSRGGFKSPDPTDLYEVRPDPPHFITFIWFICLLTPPRVIAEVAPDDDLLAPVNLR